MNDKPELTPSETGAVIHTARLRREADFSSRHLEEAAARIARAEKNPDAYVLDTLEVAKSDPKALQSMVSQYGSRTKPSSHIKGVGVALGRPLSKQR